VVFSASQSVNFGDVMEPRSGDDSGFVQFSPLAVQKAAKAGGDLIDLPAVVYNVLGYIVFFQKAQALFG
jgi:hypothetical protein